MSIEKAISYFAEVALPLIRKHQPDLTNRINAVVSGSFAIGQQDEHSDIEIIVYLEDSLWKDHGKMLQLLMQHPPRKFNPSHPFYCDRKLEYLYNWHIWGHPEVNVHPLSWILAGQAQGFLSNGGENHWGNVSVENLFEMTHVVALVDSDNLIQRLQYKAVETNAPEWFWRKHLILRFCELRGCPHAFEVAVKRNRMLEANLTLHPLLRVLSQIALLLERKYYPWWENHQEWALRQISIAGEILPLFHTMISHPDWNLRVECMHTMIRLFTDIALAKDMISMEILDNLMAAKDYEAWRNTDWMTKIPRILSKGTGSGLFTGGWMDLGTVGVTIDRVNKKGYRYRL